MANLSSTQYTQLIDLISEGEIEGLVDGEKSIFFDNTPLRDSAGNRNFQGVTIDATCRGTNDQAPLKYGDSISEERLVSVTVEQANPVIRTIVDNNVDSVRVTLRFPVIFTKGGAAGSTVGIEIYRRYNGGSYQLVASDTITGKSLDPYNRDYQIDLDGAFPVDIKVTRVTADSTTADVQNDFQWYSYTKIIYGRLRYPNSAVIGLRLDAKLIGSIPARSYRVRGIKVSIPNGSSVDAVTGRIVYPTGFVWDGTFAATKQWTNDPAWILWDLLLSKRYGFGDHIQAAQLDKWSFLTASQYASALVPDGFGGTEPRFSCNVNIQSAEDAYKLINDMCSVFRAMPFYTAGTVSIAQDAPQDVAHLFTLANVTEAGFSYQGSSLKGRPTVVIVSYFDMETRDLAQEVVEDLDGIERYGVQTTELQAFACTSRGQAHRIAEWLLYSTRYESEILSFTTSLDAGVVVQPGDVIEVSDPTRSGQRRGGRISSATTTAITVDNATGLTLGTSPTLSVIMPDGTVESKTVSSIVGNVVTVSSAYSTAPNANSVWVYQTADLEASTWRVIGIAESDELLYTVTATAYNSSKFDYIERDVPLQQRDITNLTTPSSPPALISAEERIYENNGVVLSQIQVSWQAVDGVDQYRIRYRFNDSNYHTSDQTSLTYNIETSERGTYEIEVYSINPSTNNQSPTAASLTVEAYGKTAAPATPTGLSMIAIDEASAIISWDRSTELDVILNGKVLIRHQATLAGALWEEGQEIVAAAAGGQTQKQVPLLEGTYMVKFEDDTGNRSTTAASIVVDLPTPQPRSLVQTYTHPPFTGTYGDTFFFTAPTGDGISISNDVYVDDMATDGDWDALGSIDNIGGALEIGTYTFNQTLDLNQVYDVNLLRTLEFYTHIGGSLWDDKTGDIDTWSVIDELGDRTGAAMYVRTTDDNPSGTPTWSEWREFANAIVRGRGLQFKVVLTTTDESQMPVVTNASVAVELQQRTEASAVLTSSATLATYNFDVPFYEPPSVGITMYDMNSNDELAVSNVTRTGFDLEVIHGGTPQPHSFTYTATGFGKEII